MGFFAEGQNLALGQNNVKREFITMSSERDKPVIGTIFKQAIIQQLWETELHLHTKATARTISPGWLHRTTVTKRNC